MYIPDSLIEVYGARIGPFGIAVYTCLASQADAHGQAQVSLDRMATMISLSRRSIIRALFVLKAEGLLTKQQTQQRSVYQLMLPSAPQAPWSAPQAPWSAPQAPWSAPQAPCLLAGNGDEISSPGTPLPDPNAFVDPEISLDPKTKAAHTRKRKAAGRRTKTLMPQEVTIQQEWYQAIISRPSFQSWLKDVALMHSDLESQWNAFVRKALANGYKYLDWYSAFQNWLTSPYQHQQNGRMATQPYQSVDELKQILDEDDAWRKTL